ncbi:MAG: AsnC family protein [Proteobacteria bacterium]|nr:AsnC family protein [Pseudomonadota bacterium]
MPKKLPWTDAQDTRLRRLRAEGAHWDAIAALFGVTRWAAIERGRRIGAFPRPAGFVPPPEDPERDPLPPGHPHSWGAITAGTVLEDVPYPLPVFVP